MKHNDPDIKAIDAVINKVGSYSEDGDINNKDSDGADKGDLQ